MNRSRRSSDTTLSDEVLIAAFAHRCFTDMFLSQNRRAQFGLLVSASLVGFIWHGQRNGAAVAVWFAALLLVTAARFVFTEKWLRRADPQGATRRIAIVLLVNGLLMALPLVAFGGFSQLERAAVSIVLLASATASVATTSGYRLVFLAFAAPMLLPLAAAWAFTAPGENARGAALGLGALVIVFLLFLVSIGRQANEVFAEICRFRYGEQKLNRTLTQALEQASDANRAKTHFLAAASHDLRQPIHSMNVLVAALSLRELDPRSRDIVALLDSVNQTLSRQLDGLLDISKLDAGTIKPLLTVQRLDRLAASHHAALAPVARERGLQFVLDVSAEVSVLTDATLLSRALGNLTDNAFKFTRRGGSVTVAVRREGGHAVVSVADTGIGIPAAEHENVFREFYQVGNVERDRSKGLGLGLSIVGRLCGLLGAQVALDSRPGAGTRIALALPEVEAQATTVPAMPKLHIAAGLAVLVIDDEALVRDSMRMLLTELGCRVHVADGTAQALDLARRHPVDAVLSDYRLRDGESGLEAMRAVLRIHASARAVLVTGDTAPDRLRDAEAAGVPLLHKPVTLRQLMSVLQPSAP